jgi:uncharacterized membrane protein YkoI
MPNGHRNYLWDGAATDARALSRATTGRVAGTWFGETFSIELALSDGQAHQVAIYGIDWDARGRSQRVEVLDAATGSVLDRRDVSNFSGGQYWIYQVKGSVNIRVTRTAGPNAVISAVFVDAVGTTPTQPVQPSPNAQFLRTDTTTKGTWKGVYGTEGYGLAKEPAHYPTSARVTISGGTDWVWNASTTDARALQHTDSGRFAATWFGSVFNIDVTLTDGAAHEVALYALDWDGGRTQRVEIVDAASGAVLDTRTVSSFGGGQYLVYSVKTSVRFRITRTAGANAVVSGIFIDSAAARTASTSTSATFVQADTTTKGNWKGAYGAQGFAIVRDRTSLPASARLAVKQADPWTWSEATTDVRALQRADTGRLASTWFGEKLSFGLTFTDGQAHRVAMYAVDWDSGGRAQEITVTNAATGAVLDRRSVKGFGSGQYYVWRVAGAINVTVTRASGPNAVVSGVFID